MVPAKLVFMNRLIAIIRRNALLIFSNFLLMAIIEEFEKVLYSQQTNHNRMNPVFSYGANQSVLILVLFVKYFQAGSYDKKSDNKIGVIGCYRMLMLLYMVFAYD